MTCREMVEEVLKEKPSAEILGQLLLTLAGVTDKRDETIIQMSTGYSLLFEYAKLSNLKLPDQFDALKKNFIDVAEDVKGFHTENVWEEE